MDSKEDFSDLQEETVAAMQSIGRQFPYCGFGACFKAMENYYDLTTTVDEYRRGRNGHGLEICQVSPPQALACFFECESYEDVIRNSISIGGDSDTLGAIAGGIAEAFYGIPDDIRKQIWDYLQPVLTKVCKEFEEWNKKQN